MICSTNNILLYVQSLLLFTDCSVHLPPLVHPTYSKSAKSESAKSEKMSAEKASSPKASTKSEKVAPARF